MARISIQTGDEGPRHDPYGWEEVVFTKTDGTKVVIRSGGLGYARLEVNGVKTMELYEPDDHVVFEEFERLTGISFERATKIYHERFNCDNIYGSLGRYI